MSDTAVLFNRFFQLHNQIEDMKGQTRMYARVRPMDALEKEAGCKEVTEIAQPPPSFECFLSQIAFEVPVIFPLA